LLHNGDCNQRPHNRHIDSPIERNRCEEKHELGSVSSLERFLAKLEEGSPIGSEVNVDQICKQMELEVILVALDHRPFLEERTQIIAYGDSGGPLLQKKGSLKGIHTCATLDQRW